MLPLNIHRLIFLFGACALAFGMMMGTVPTSVPQLILLGNWLVEMNFKEKWARIKSNRIFWILSSVYFVHLFGLIYTSDLASGLNDIRIKLPLLFLPLVFFSSKPLSLRELHLVFYCFLAGSFVNVGWCLVYSFILHNNEVGRDASRFMSHIRLGLYLNMAVACCIYFASIAETMLKKVSLVIAAVYFIFIMYVLGLASGLVNFFILSFLAVCVIVYYQKPLIKVIAFVLLIVAAGFVIKNILVISNSQLNVHATKNNLPARQSPSGRPYSHFDTIGQKENGNYVLINIQLDELKKEWQLLFPVDSFNFHPQAYNINRYEVLIRYLASKGLNKDSVGISKLSAEDKNNIRMDVCNYQYTDWSFMHKRIYELVCEYDDFNQSRDVNGHSLTMRFYFWGAAVKVIRAHPLAGVGTGDVQQELEKIYVESHSPLEKEWYKRPHNQFLTIVVALGITGLLVFLISIIYPVVVFHRFLPILYWPFIILALVSFLLEDTLETQAGLSFYAVFNTLFVSFAYSSSIRNRI